MGRVPAYPRLPAYPRVPKFSFNLGGIINFAQLSFVTGAVIVFIILIGLDAWKARKKGIHWIPGHTLVLTALTIQGMNLLNGQAEVFRKATVSYCNNKEVDEVEKYICENWENFIMIHVSRMMLCVLVAYLLPGMARQGSKESWGKLAALGLSILLNVFSDVFNVDGSYYLVVLLPVFIIPGVIILICLLWLILLLSCATIAHKSIRDIINQRIPIMLGQQSDGADNRDPWDTVEDQVLKSWIVARACYPESIIATSVLSSSAAVAVTICIVSSLVKMWPFVGLDPFQPELSFKVTTTMLELLFILIGWAIIFWRWVSSVAYYGTWGTEQEEKSWRNYFRVEDFWTRHIIELQQPAVSPGLIDGTSQLRKIITISTYHITAYLSRILLQCLYWLQFLVVFSSKGWWFLSELVFRALRSLLSILGNREMSECRDYINILDNVHFLWVTRQSVLASNRKGIIKAEKLLSDGKKDGESCNTLVSFLKEKKSRECLGERCLDPRAASADPAAAIADLAAGQTRLRFLCKQDPGPKLAVEEHFMYASKKSWKLTAISLVAIIVRLFPDSGRNCLKAYSEAWQVMGVVDEYDEGAHSLLSESADRVFNTLQSASKAIAEPAKENKEKAEGITMGVVAEAIKKLAEENEKKAEVIRDGKDSLDWKKAAEGNAIYKLCKSIDCGDSDDVSALENELQSALADIIHGCIEKVRDALVENCIKWAQDLEEEKLVQALYLAGKSRVLMKKVGPATT